MAPYRACDVELAARVSKLALSFSSQNIRLPLQQCIVSPLRLLPFFSSFLFLAAARFDLCSTCAPFVSRPYLLFLSLFATWLVVYSKFAVRSAPRISALQRTDDRIAARQPIGHFFQEIFHPRVHQQYFSFFKTRDRIFFPCLFGVTSREYFSQIL